MVSDKERVLELLIRNPDGIGTSLVMGELKVSWYVANALLEDLVEEGKASKRRRYGRKLSYVWFVTYYPKPELLPPEVKLPLEVKPPVPTIEPEFVHITLVYNKKTKDEEGRDLDISLTFDFDCKNDDDVKSTLKKYLFGLADGWIDSKFGGNVPYSDRWAEVKEKPSDGEVARNLRRSGSEFTELHYKWFYDRQFGGKHEEAEGDFSDWESELPTGPTWGGVKKGRRRKSK